MRLKLKVSRIFSRFLCTYAIIILIPMLVLGSFFYNCFFDYLQKSIEKSSYNILEKAVYVHETTMDQLENVLNQIYLSESFTPFHLESFPERTFQLKNELKIIKNVNQFIDEVVIHYKEDKYIYTSRSSYEMDHFLNQAYIFEKASPQELKGILLAAGEPVTLSMQSVAYYDDSTNDYICYVYPIPNKSVNPYATVMFMIPQKKYENVFKSNSSIPSNTYIFSNEQLITQIYEFKIEQEIIESMKLGDYKQKYFWDKNNKKYLVSVSKNNKSLLTYYNVVAVDDIFNPLYRMKDIFVVTNFIIVTICGFLMFFFSRMNYSPMKKIIKIVKNSSGNLNSPSNDINTILNEIEVIYKQNHTLNIELNVSKQSQSKLLLLDFLQGKLANKDNIYLTCKEMGFDIAKSYYDIMFIRISRRCPSEINPEYFNTYFSQFSTSDFQTYTTELVMQKGIVLVSFFNNKDFSVHVKQKLIKGLEKKGFQGNIGISNIYSEISNSSKAFIEAYTALLYARVQSNCEIVYFSQAKDETKDLENYPYKLIDEFNKSLHHPDIMKIFDVIFRIKNYIEGRTITHLVAQCIFRDLLDGLVKRALQLNMDTTKINEVYKNISYLESVPSLDELEDSIRNICIDICEETSRVDKINENDMIKDIIDFIQKNCMHPNFSLSMAAEHFNMSASRFSIYFKDKTNMLPSTYISDFKINQAKILLQKTDKTVSDICTGLGYNDLSSFIRKFKDATGVTPYAYRKNSQTANKN